VIGCEDRLRNDLYYVGWGVKLYSVQSNQATCDLCMFIYRGHSDVRTVSSRVAEHLSEGSVKWDRLNKAALVIGLLAAFAITIVANFPVCKANDKFFGRVL